MNFSELGPSVSLGLGFSAQVPGSFKVKNELKTSHLTVQPARLGVWEACLSQITTYAVLMAFNSAVRTRKENG